VASLSADIEALNSEIEIVRDDPEKRQKLQDERISKSEELSQARAKLSIVVVKVQDTTNVISRSEQGLPVVPADNVADAITSISSKITVALLESVFPKSAEKNIEASTPYLQAALQEFKISDSRLAAIIVATIAVETPNFQVFEESIEAAQRRENLKLPGDTQPGDVVRYRSRGYLGITGRTNYATMSTRLGLGTRLLDTPEDAKSPEVACRILVAWFVDRQEKLSAALASGDLAAFRRAVRGPVVDQADLSKFSAIYHKVLAQL